MNLEWHASRLAPALCQTQERARASAARAASFMLLPEKRVLQHARQLATAHTGAAGRVLSAGKFTDDVLARRLRAALPPGLAAALRTTFEWYGCRGAHFHNDAHYADVMFGAWCLAGPARDLVFPRAGWRMACQPGTAVIFDPFEPHAVLEPGATRYDSDVYAAAPPSMFLAFELGLDSEEARSAFGIGTADAGATVLSSQRAVNAVTGQLA